MTKIKYLLLILLCTKAIYGHDTLKFVKSYVLYKVPTQFVIDNSNEVCLPVQYHNLTKTAIIDYRRRAYCNEDIEFEYDQNLIVKSVGRCDSLDVDSIGIKHELPNFADTVYISKDALISFRPYIKTKTGNLYFVDYQILLIKDGIMKSFKVKNSDTGHIFEYIDDLMFINDFTNTIIVLNKAYYRNKTTAQSHS